VTVAMPTDYRRGTCTGLEKPEYFKPRACDFCHEKPRKKQFRRNFMNGEGAKMFCSQKCKDGHLAKHKY